MRTKATTRPARGKRKPAPAERRHYDSPVRRQRTEETREQILAAGARIAHGLSGWDWRGLTFRAVGERAGVSERTVHRYFSTERKLRGAVLQRLVQESGIVLESLELDNFAKVCTGLLGYLSSFAATATTKQESDPSMVAIDQNRREALLGAVTRAARQWSEGERTMAAAMLDILWNPPTYERLLDAWGLDVGQAAGAINWLAGLIEEAVRKNRRPLAGG
jgi:AcrR family transcriptional regulator